uniref:Protein YIP n=1 Tax=Phaseolus vulgaris TaxID=3885 RepID=V7D1R1_PHAVU|nr:hypothetical protein PHAVU_001G237000g [Phaseolus vulgaris]ESW35465.1 hypothetical protein PHAVU_001G237000g [Phaseolus vulgaris]
MKRVAQLMTSLMRACKHSPLPMGLAEDRHIKLLELQLKHLGNNQQATGRYGLIWISTTLVFVLALLGNLATYLTQKHADNTTSWSFDVSFVNTAAWSIYGYVIVVPLAYYFFLQYMGSNANIIRFWCMWGYSLTIFIMSSFLLLVPVGFLRWIIIILSGVASASFVALNLRSFIEGNDVSVAVIAAFFLQIALAVFIKVRFFG